MKGYNQLKLKVRNLLQKHNELREQHEELKEKYSRVKKDYEYLSSQNRDIPEVIKKNKILNEQRKEVQAKIDKILSRMAEINI
jgi:seryl-tRNA synthetase